MTTRVINCKGGNRNFDIYIGRRTWPIPENSKWRNPYSAIKYGREKAIEMYREYIMNKPELLELIPTELKDKRLGCRLGCWCAPLSCHGDVLAKIADSD